MTTFTLDTSGGVWMTNAQGDRSPMWWDDLTPFAQGCVAAMFASVAPVRYRHPYGKSLTGLCSGCGKIEHRPQGWRFSDLAPETLARIIADCEAYRLAAGMLGLLNNEAQGRHFWNARQRPGGTTDGAGYHGLDERSTRYNPLTVYLGEDGLVYLRERGEPGESAA